MAKSEYAVFRSTRFNFLFDYLRSIEGYRDGAQKYTKNSEQTDLRKALVALFSDQGDNQDEAESAADINLIAAQNDETHKDELIGLLNARVNLVADIDPLLELHIYLLKSAMQMQNPDPSFASITKQVESEAKKPSESLHLDWINSAADSSTQQYATEEAYRFQQAFTAVKYRMVHLQRSFRAFLRKKVENEMFEQEKNKQRWSLFAKRTEEKRQEEKFRSQKKTSDPVPLG